MMPTPVITAAIATQVFKGTRSPNSKNAISAAISGTPAWMSKILATVVYESATTTHVEASAKHAPTPTPAQPMARNSCSVPRRPWRCSMNQSKNTEAKKARQKTIVQLSVTLR